MNRAIRHVLVAMLLLAGSALAPAQAAELKVLCAGAMRAALQELAPQFEKSSGTKLVVEFATAAKVEQQVAADQSFDVAILTKPRADKLIKTAKLVGGVSATLARAPIGVAVKQGTAHPDIASLDAFKHMLLNAKSVAYIDPASGGASGVHMAQVIDKLGLAAALKPKTHLISSQPGQAGLHEVGEAVRRGEAEIGLQPISELRGVEGIDVVGPIPAELQSPDLTFVAAASNFAAQPAAAKALVDFLAGAAAKAVYKAKGMEPG